MPRINAVQLNQVDGSVKDAFEGIRKAYGAVPNVFQSIAQSPDAFFGYLAAHDRLSKGRLSKAEREIIALVVAQHNECEYCLSAHTLSAKAVGIPYSESISIRQGTASDEGQQALVTFVRAVVQNSGRLANSEITEFKSHGFTDSHIVEVILGIALSYFTNFFNNLNETTLDFPKADAI